MSAIIYGVIYCDRIADKNVGIIEQCLFVSLSSNGKGSVIYFSSLKTVSLNISNSCFRYCNGEKEGGTIYFVSRSLILINSCFEFSYTKGTYDRCFGSVIYSDSEDILYKINAFQYCGPHGTQTGDSTLYHTSSNYCSIDNLNNTNCNNKWGTAGPYLNTASTDICVVKYVNIIQCSGYHIFGNLGTMTDAYYLNILNTSAINQQLFTCSKMHFYYSYIYFANFEEILYGSITFTECYGNFANEGVTANVGAITGNYHVKRGDGCFLIMIKSDRVIARSSFVMSPLLLFVQEML